jgi:glycosyltransferase involved in cell wall biosynthesis
MKIVLVTEYFYPYSKGGTEQYVYYLAKGLQSQGHVVTVIAVHEHLDENEYEGIKTLYIKPHLGLEPAVIKGYQPANNLAYFESLMLKLNADIMHFHTFTTSINHHHIAVAQQHHVKIVFTSHIPDHICLTGGLRQNGNKVCNGKVEILKCSYCASKAKSENIFFKILRFFKYTAPIAGTPVKNKLRDLRLLNKLSDQLVMVSDWQKDYWEKNIMPRVPIMICRQGVSFSSPKMTKSSSSQIRLGYVGRISSIKGLHLIFEALQLLGDASFQLNIAGITSEKEVKYYEGLKEMNLASNVNWALNLSASEVETFYGELDYLVIPSLWLETGPFVAYEALAKGIPIIGSRLGGIKEVIEENVNGLLFEPNAEDLALILKSLKSNKHQFDMNHTEVREANLISLEMEKVYERLVL